MYLTDPGKVETEIINIATNGKIEKPESLRHISTIISPQMVPSPPHLN